MVEIVDVVLDPCKIDWVIGRLYLICRLTHVVL